MSPSLLDDGPQPETPLVAVRGKVSRAPEDFFDALTVILPNYSSEYSFDIQNGNWMAKGASLPKKDDECVVVFDEDNDAWIASWEGYQHNHFTNMLVGVDEDYQTPATFGAGDSVWADFLGYGPEPAKRVSGAGQSEVVGFSGTMHLDAISHRLNGPTAIRVNSIGDNTQYRGGRPPGWGHHYPAGGAGLVRRRPVGQSTWLGLDHASNATELFIFPAKDFRSYEDNSNPPPIVLKAADQVIEYTGKQSIAAWLCGDHPVGATELTVVDAEVELPDAGPFRLRSLQGTYTGKEVIFDADLDGPHKAGSNILTVRNVTQDMWDDLSVRSVPFGALRVERSTAGFRRFKYEAATYNSSTQKATFTLRNDSLLDRNASDGAEITVSRLTGVTTDFVHLVDRTYLEGEMKLGLTLVHPYDRAFLGSAAPKTDPALVALVPTSGFLRVECSDFPDPPGPGFIDYPVKRIPYTDFNVETGEITLAEPLPMPVSKHNIVEMEGCPGLLRSRLHGQEVIMHKLTGVTGLTLGGGKGEVVEYSPRYGHPQGSGSAMHIALDTWTGTGYDGYATNIVHGLATESHGDQANGAYMNHMVTTPVSGFRLQKLMIDALGLAVLGAGVRGRGDIKHMLHVGGPYTLVKPPNIALDPDNPDPDEFEIDPSDPDAGQILTATLNVAFAATMKAPSKIKVFCHNRELGIDQLRVFPFTGITEGPPNPALTGLSYNQTENGPKTVLNNDVVLPLTGDLPASSVGFDSPVSSFKGKLRAIVGGAVVARWTYTGRNGPVTAFTGCETTFGSGTIPAGALIEEDYLISDFWVGNGIEVSIADDVAHPAIGSATGIEWGTDRVYGGMLGSVGPTAEQGILFEGPTGTRTLYIRGIDGKLGTGIADTIATEAYVDAFIQGVKWKTGVRTATTAVPGNIALSGLQTIDGVVLVAGDRVLVKNQTDQKQNGIYAVAAGAWARVADADSGVEMQSAVVQVSASASTQPNSTWRQITDPVTLGVSNIIWTDVTGITTAGAGMTRSGSTIDVGAGEAIQVDADSVTIKLDGTSLTKSPAGLKVTPGTTDPPGGAYGYKIPAGVTARIAEGQYMVIAGDDIIDIEGTLDLEGRILYVSEI